MTTTQAVRVETPGCAAARCELSNDRGTWPLARTPGSAVVQVSGEPLKVSCQADGEALASTQAALTAGGTSGVGGAVGAVVGGSAVGAAVGGAAMAYIPPLGAIAVLTGAVAGGVAGNAAESRSQQLRYPGLIRMPMSCQTAGGAAAPDDGMPPRLGLTVRGMTRGEALAQGVGQRSAVLVLAVAAEGPAAAAGLRGGDILLALNGKDLGDAADLEERLQDLPAASMASLRVWRERQMLEVVLKPAGSQRP